MHRLFYMMKRSRKLISANKGETIMSNTVITIARQYGSGGRTVGKMLAKRLDIPCYDREIISLASEESGIHPTLFQDEKKKARLSACVPYRRLQKCLPAFPGKRRFYKG